MTAIIHIAGDQVQVGPRLRQRCSWCGAVLLDYDLTRIALCVEVPGEQDRGHRPAMWELGSLVGADGNAQWVIGHRDGDDLPDGSCALIDHEVTA